MREFLRGLLAEISIQPMVEGVLFFGNYDKTPRGIHKDPVDIFLFVIEGHKKMYLWPEEFFQGGEDHDARLHSDFSVLRGCAHSGGRARRCDLLAFRLLACRRGRGWLVSQSQPCT